jgi:hypothetical protein
MRWRTTATDPAAWAWPMAIAVAFAPVVYPWYLLYITPFLFTAACLPLTVWTFSSLSVYIVWYLARHGWRWMPPPPIMALEYGVVVLAAIYVFVLQRRAAAPEPIAHR